VRKIAFLFVLIMLVSNQFGTTMTYHLGRGWNMIALPCLAATDSIHDLFPSVGDIYVYSNSVRSYESMSTTPLPNIGFFLLCPVDTTIIIECECVDVIDTTDCDCTNNDGLPYYMYCEKAVGDCSGCGVISMRPEVCLGIYLPVCACNGLTYGNSCSAAQAGQNVAYDGVCTKSDDKKLKK